MKAKRKRRQRVETKKKKMLIYTDVTDTDVFNHTHTHHLCRLNCCNKNTHMLNENNLLVRINSSYAAKLETGLCLSDSLIKFIQTL